MAADLWFPYIKQSARPVVRLFCFPYAGGSAHLYRHWPDHLPATIEVWPVELPGRGNRLMEVPFTRLTSLVHAAARALLGHLDRPFAFFGHSMGALVAFELARLLRREHGLSPLQLFASAARAPQLCEPGPHISSLPQPEFLEKLRGLGGTPREVLEQPELMELLGVILRADFAVCDTYSYVPDAPLNCPLSVFGGLQDPEVGADQLDAWRAQTIAPFSRHMFPGGHFFLQHNPALIPGLLARDLEVTAGRHARL
jgi:medium-chain acyl-[acyl-carrier-protein] hydrolase